MSILGTRVTRREDPRLVTGAGAYVADLAIPELEGALTVAFVRSTIAHARLVEVDTSEATELPGVVAVFTAADLDLPAPRPRMPWVPKEMARPWLATDTVRFVGEPVAMIVADNAAAAADAAELVIVDVDPLPPVVDPEAATGPDATLLFPGAGTNVAVENPAERDEHLFDGCEVVVSGRMVHQRVAACPLEGRATAASWDGERLTVWISTQHAHGARGAFAAGLGVDPATVRVIAPDVGGGFGAKIGSYPEDLLTAWAARRLDRPTRWVESRSESMVGLGHGRAQVHRFEIGGSRDGRVAAFRLDVTADGGAYPSMAAFLPTFTRLMAPGTYDIGRVEASSRTVVTNTTQVEAYRGAGRPEATAVIERAMDLFAAEVGLDPAEVRRANLVGADRFPFTTATGATYDVGDFEGALDKALAAAGYAELRAEQARRRAAGESPLLGIGVSTYVEITAGGGPPTEFGAVEVHADGTVTVRTGSSPHGQGHHTVWASLVADRLGVDPTAVTVLHGDTDLVPRGAGTMGSRSLQLGGVAAVNASDLVIERAREIAADQFEAAVEDVVFESDGGAFHVAGTPARSLGWTEVAAAAAEAGEALAAETDFQAAGPTFPFGAHVAVVEVDPDTGLARLVRMVACDDAGTIVNPLLADGQRHGGLAQGAAQALLEEFVYDADGNPLTTTFADYTFVSAMELPDFELVSQETPTPYNPLGAKGIGESATIGSTPAVQSAVIDAVAHLGVRHIDMPCTPERVWRAIHSAD